MSGVAGQLDQLRIALADTEALASVTVESFDRQDFDGADPVYVERLASLLGLISRSASGALAAFHALHGALADAEPVPAGEQWGGEGTAAGEEPDPARDAAILRRLREHTRFDGRSDAELVQAFKRNKQVLGRSDEDVIVAMVHAG